MQTIIAYIIIGVAVGYTIYSIVRALSLVGTDTNDSIKCGGSCGSCPIKILRNARITLQIQGPMKSNLRDTEILHNSITP